MTERPPIRRRGEALEEAILDAAWAELEEHGFGPFTLEAVANRAQTSRPVLARRWPDRSALAIAAWRRNMQRTSVLTPDTGSLRTDLISLLKDLAAQRTSLIAPLAFHLQGGLWPGQSLADVRSELLGNGDDPLDAILARAIERGEIDPAKLTARIRTLPVDLMRHEVIMTAQPVTEATIIEIIDGAFLPLVVSSGPTETS